MAALVKTGPVLALVISNYVSNRLKADVELEVLRTENDQPH